jgi:hypothetical protein
MGLPTGTVADTGVVGVKADVAIGSDVAVRSDGGFGANGTTADAVAWGIKPDSKLGVIAVAAAPGVFVIGRGASLVGTPPVLVARGEAQENRKRAAQRTTDHSNARLQRLCENTC